jgi:hypothetical protein
MCYGPVTALTFAALAIPVAAVMLVSRASSRHERSEDEYDGMGTLASTPSCRSRTHSHRERHAPRQGCTRDMAGTSMDFKAGCQAHLLPPLPIQEAGRVLHCNGLWRRSCGAHGRQRPYQVSVILRLRRRRRRRLLLLLMCLRLCLHPRCGWQEAQGDTTIARMTSAPQAYMSHEYACYCRLQTDRVT